MSLRHSLQYCLYNRWYRYTDTKGPELLICLKFKSFCDDRVWKSPVDEKPTKKDDYNNTANVTY